MSFSTQRNVCDGTEVVKRDDSEVRDPTNGTLVHGLCPGKTARPLKTDDTGVLMVTNDELLAVLGHILMELKKMNVYNTMSHDCVIRDRDISGDV